MNQPTSINPSLLTVGWGRGPASARSGSAFDRPHWLWPVFLCVWILSSITIAPPEDWKVGRFGTAPVLPLPVMSAIKAGGRPIALSLLGFSLLSLAAPSENPCRGWLPRSALAVCRMGGCFRIVVRDQVDFAHPSGDPGHPDRRRRRCWPSFGNGTATRNASCGS